MRGSGLAIVVAAGLVPLATGDFSFPDFNQTQGLVFNGDAVTTSCTEHLEATAYGDVQGDPVDEDELEVQRAETIQSYTERTVRTDPGDASSEDIASKTAIFGHRDDFVAEQTRRCPVRVRLTPSRSSRAGSIWYHIPVAVSTGFQTLFTFQVSDHSRECVKAKDPTFSLHHYESCAVHGGDGLAFVVHRDPNETEALGRDGRGLGYEGIQNSLAVEFDSWYNPDTNTTTTGVDLMVDHVAIHSRSTLANSGDESAALGQQRPHPVADGSTHLVKVQYLPYVASQYLGRFTATPNLVPFIKDNDESRRLGTLVVFMDEGIEKDEPITAIPINLSVLLQLPQDQAYVGFTASTGLQWEKHDITSWLWCDREDCDDTEFEKFDYHQQSKFSAAAHSPLNNPGMGYGGTSSRNVPGESVRGGAPTRHASPPTEPWAAPKEHHSKDRNEGLYESAAMQVPPSTALR